MKRMFSMFVIVACSCCYPLASGTLSKSDPKRLPNKMVDVQPSPATESVSERELVVTAVHWKDVVMEEKRYWDEIQKNFKGAVLGYVTPWNSHGYDIAKLFGPKLTSVSPVWLQLRRRGRERFEITGLHDHDESWVKAVRTSNQKVRIVPRLLFDDWSYEDYLSVLSSEDEIEELGSVLVKVAQLEKIDGYTLELWSQLGGQKKKELVHLIRHTCETLKANQLDCILVIPPPVTNTGKPGMFGREEFEQLAPVVDAFSLMTYDYSSGLKPGPNSPLPWLKECILQLAPSTEWRSKILLGVNLYGVDFANQQTEPVIGREYIEILREHKPKIVWDDLASEHFFAYKKSNAVKHVVYYPSLKSLFMRIAVAKKFGIGISLWELGQGLDYFYDLL
ncbi:chitinase domain-containing protein 1 [Stigmatopora argus]